MISEKLQAIINIKGNLKTAINNAGGNLTNSSPFSQYPNQIQPVKTNIWFITDCITSSVSIAGISKSVSISEATLFKVTPNTSYSLVFPLGEYDIQVKEFDSNGTITNTYILDNGVEGETTITYTLTTLAKDLSIRVLENLSDVVGTINNNVIELFTSVPTGTYTLKYEDADNNVLENWKNIGTITQ